MTTRQVRRAEERHAEKVASSEARGFKYPEAKHSPVMPTGKTHTTNGTQETTRRLRSAA